MRTYGRITNADGSQTWVVVQTDASGFNDYVYATAICQVLKLNLGESPFYSNYGIPAHDSVIQQVAPTFYAQRTQKQFSPYFANLVVAFQGMLGSPPTPNYQVAITTQQGVKIAGNIPT